MWKNRWLDTRPVDFKTVLYKERAKINLRRQKYKSLLKMLVGLKLLQCSASNFLPICFPAISHMTKVSCVQIFDKITKQLISSKFYT